MSRKPSTDWTIADLIDFEIFIAEDERVDEVDEEIGDVDGNELEKRDRAIFLEIEKEFPGGGELRSTGGSRRFLFRQWLKLERKRRFRGEETPGEEIISWFQFWAWVLLGLGFLSALGLVLVFFGNGASAESAPQVNVLWFSWVCIILPCALTVWGFCLALGCFRRNSLPPAPVFLRGLYSRWLRSRLDRRLVATIGEPVTAESRLRLAAARGVLKSVIASRRKILSAYLFLWIQFLALGYALGLVGLTVAHVRWVSHDFAWQSTLSSTPDSFHQRISLASLPWSWLLGEGEGYPSLEQIRATRYTKRDPLEEQPVGAWAAWGRFMIFAGMTYVAIPRFLLFILSRGRLRRALRVEDFGDARFEPLLERMKAPITNWSRDAPSAGDGEDPPKFPDTPSDARKAPSAAIEQDVCVLGVSEDFDFQSISSAAREFFAVTRDWEVTQTLRVFETVKGREEFVSEAARILTVPGSRRVILIEEAGMPPVLERVNLVKALRSKIGVGPSIVVALLGDPSDQPLGDPPSKVSLDVWEKTLNAIGDSHLRVVTFNK